MTSIKKIMGHPKNFSILLISFLLLLFISHGFGAQVRGSMGDAGYVSKSKKESGGISRKMMIEVMDYADPGPNTNVRGGLLSPPPPSAN